MMKGSVGASAAVSTFLARRWVYSKQCARGWIRKLLQLSLSPLWSLLSWRVWDSRASHTCATELPLGSFLCICEAGRQQSQGCACVLHKNTLELLVSCALRISFTFWSSRRTFQQVFPESGRTRFQSPPAAWGSRSCPAAAGSSAPESSPAPSAGLQADNEPLKGDQTWRGKKACMAEYNSFWKCCQKWELVFVSPQKK